MHTRLAIICGFLAASIVVPGAAHAAQDAQANPPAPETLRQTTTAMLQPADVSAALGGPASLNIGYYIPPGGQDPYPICQGNIRREILPSLEMATGYFSTVGNVNQTVYVYPSQELAAASWSGLRSLITRGCYFTRSVDGNRIRVSSGEAPSISGMWTVSSITGKDPSGEYTQVAVVDNAIVALRFNTYDAPTSSVERGAAAELMQQLTTRYADRMVPTGVQSTALSVAETAMLTPSDLPASLPVRSPANGAWSSFDANIPGTAPFNQCSPRKDLMPAGTGSYSVEFGDDGGPMLTDGFAWQQVFTFQDASAADAAWTALNRNWKDCNQRYGRLYNKTGPARLGRAGTSSVNVDGTPGLYLRYVETQADSNADYQWTTRTYQLFLKDGNVISSLTYGVSVDGLKRVSIDEAAVNQLAVLLIDRFANTVVTTP